MIVRNPAVAGYFYPRDREELSSLLDSLLREAKEEPKDVLGCVVPHAGYAYCGKTQARAYRSLGNGDYVFVILGPDHSGTGPRASIMTAGRWRTPLGDYPINNELAVEIRNEAGLVEDISAHSQEHSIEVQIPWLQKRFPRSSFIPLSLGSLTPGDMESLGKAISKISVGRRMVLIASSDFTHYGVNYGHIPFSGSDKEILEMMEQVDREAAQAIASVDPRGFLSIVEKYGATICGYIPIATMLYAVGEWATKGKVLDYSTSYPISKSTDAIVGYSSIIII